MDEKELVRKAHEALDESIVAIKAAVVAACQSAPTQEPYRSAMQRALEARARLLRALDDVLDEAVRERGPCA